ncbi:MAG: hypothetical protein JXR96_07610 [Deltaproteobacteria bacterium]|nr:hypothetical protein [Deltaproteobacteria bacterium]
MGSEEERGESRRGFVAESVRFAVDSTMAISAPAGALRLRWPLWIRAAAGGVLGRIYHQLGIPFQWTPLLAVPAALIGACFLYQGLLWAGVLCSFIVAVADIADGVATGWEVNHLPPDEKPKGKLALRRFLDTWIVDVISRMSLYGVFVLRLHQEQGVPAWLLALLLGIELANLGLAALAEGSQRRQEFFYEFVLDEVGASRFQPFYALRVLGGHLCAYHCYSLFPLLGYLMPLAEYGALFFFALLALRMGVLTGRLAPRLRAAAA